MFETKRGVIKPIVYVGIVKGDRLLLVDYTSAPNPDKKGWWIPAPGLEFGEDPQEKAQAVLAELGYISTPVKLYSVESFVLPGGWHLIHHYVCKVTTDPKSHDNFKAYKWVNQAELESMTDIAHGRWEIGVGKSYLNSMSN